MGQYDHCTLTDGYVTCDLYVRSWNTTLSSNMSSTAKKDGAWFSAWQPAQDTMSLTIRQPSTVGQATTVTTLQKWLGDQSILTFSWTERSMSYQCVIKSAPTNLRYDAVMVDLNLTLQLLTNSFMKTSRGYVVTSGIQQMLLADLVSQTTDDFQMPGDESKFGDVSKRFMSEQKSQISGWDVTYKSDGTVIFKKHYELGDSMSNLFSKSYEIKVNDSFVKALNDGMDIEATLREYASGGK